MSKTLTLAATLALFSASAFAQETYWVANRRTNDIHEIDTGGVTLRSIPLTSNLRSAHRAPDGKVWVVRFIQSTFDIVDPATGIANPVIFPGGSVYSVTFDRAGHAWMTGGSTVGEYDANGNLLTSYQVSANALGITVDNGGNKWIAHRNSPTEVSRIDATTGVVTSHVVPASTMLPVNVVADYRGFSSGLPSHIWVIGDSSGDVLELDELGNFVALHPTPSSSLSGLTIDLNGHVWVGSRDGTVYDIDSTGAIVNSFTVPVTDGLGLATDFAGRIWLTDRVTFSCTTPPCPPCEVKRFNSVTGTIEVPALVGIGTQSAMSTMFAHATVVDPLGDLDGDGNVNIFEVLNGSMPSDPSSSAAALVTLGSTQIAGLVRIDFRSFATMTSSVMISATAAAPSAVAGFAGDLEVGLPLIVALPVTPNSYTVSLTIPNDPSLANVELFLQGLIVSGLPSPTFANRTSIRIW
jgi:streptogramin lyase